MPHEGHEGVTDEVGGWEIEQTGEWECGWADGWVMGGRRVGEPVGEVGELEGAVG